MVYSSGLQVAWTSSRTFGLLAINLTEHLISYKHLPVYRKQVTGLCTSQRQSPFSFWVYYPLKSGHFPCHSLSGSQQCSQLWIQCCAIVLRVVFFLIGCYKMHYFLLYFGGNILACPRPLNSYKSSLSICRD